MGVFVLLWPDPGAGYDVAAWLRASVTPPTVPVVESGKGAFRVEIVIEGLESPWAVVPLPDGRIFITERPGRLRVVEDGRLRPSPVPDTGAYGPGRNEGDRLLRIAPSR